MSGESKIQNVALRLPRPLVQRLRLEGMRNGKTMTAIVRAMLDERLPKDVRIVVGKERAR